MDIIGKENIIGYCSIDDLKVGDLFLYYNNIYMKIREFNDSEGYSLNAISLENTAREYFDQKDTIIPINATLKVWR